MISRKKSVFAIIAIALLIGGIYGGLKEWTAASSGSTKDSNNQPNVSVSDLLASVNMYQLTEPKILPDFTLSSLEGESVQLSSKRGKVVLLSFWATW